MIEQTLPIARPPWSGLGKRLESAVRKAIFDFDLLDGVTKVAVALSGGKDSLTLLYMLKAISGFGLQPLELYAIHVGGEFTCGAGIGKGYLQSICSALGVPLIIRESTKTLENLECYSCSRERRAKLFEAAKSVDCETIAFGHHKDDNAQTILMNLLHKGEFAGNLPKLYMRQFGVTIIRPLAYIREREIIDFAKMYGFARITCKCPVGQHSMRRKTEELLQHIESIYPNARDNIATAGLLYGSKKAEGTDKGVKNENKI